MELDTYDNSFDYSIDDQNFYDNPPVKKEILRKVTFNPQIYSKDEEFDYELKHEVVDDSDEDQSQVQALGTIQKVPSISDLSDTEASLGNMAVHPGYDDDLTAITDEQAKLPDIGADSDAGDNLFLPRDRLSVSTNLRSGASSKASVESGKDSDDASSDSDEDSDHAASSENSFRLFGKYGTPSDSDEEMNEDVHVPEFEWSKQADDPLIYSDSKFTQTTGPKCDENIRKPLDFFSLFFTELFLCEIVQQSNLYSTQIGDN